MTIKVSVFGFIAALVAVGSAGWVMAGMGLPHDHDHPGMGIYSQDQDHHSHDAGDADHDHDHDHDHHNGEDHDHDDHGESADDDAVTMPAAKSSADKEEQTLFFTPGGLYTQDDIEANGAQLPMDKFRGVETAHDMNSKKGDLLCPITMTKASKKFPWQIGGRIYYFCCPPCVSEFVKRAKEKPADFPDPKDLIKR